MRNNPPIASSLAIINVNEDEKGYASDDSELEVFNEFNKKYKKWSLMSKGCKSQTTMGGFSHCHEKDQKKISDAYTEK